MLNKEVKGYIQLFSFSIMAGLTWTSGKIIGSTFSPLVGAFIRFSIALPLYFFIAYFFNKGIKIDKKLHKKIFVLGFLYITLYTYLFLLGLTLTSTSDGVLIFSITPLITSILSHLFYADEHLSKWKGLGLVFGIIGVYTIIVQSPNTDVPNRIFGNVIIFLASIVYSFFIVLSKPVLAEISSSLTNAWATLYGWILLFLLVLVTDFQNLIHISISNIGTLTIFAILILGLGVVYIRIVFFIGVQNIGPSKSSIFINLVPVFGVLTSIILLQEKFSVYYIFAFLLIMFGIISTAKSK